MPQIEGPDMGDSGESVDYWTEDDYPVTVRVSYPANENGEGAPQQCRHCCDEVTRTDEGEPWESDTHGAECADNITDDEDEDGMPVLGPHEVDDASELHPSRWLNSARVTVTDEEVVCAVSVGDPRGAFHFTVRRRPDGGFWIHTPYPGESEPHVDTAQEHPGTLRTV